MDGRVCCASAMDAQPEQRPFRDVFEDFAMRRVPRDGARNDLGSMNEGTEKRENLKYEDSVTFY